MTTSMVALMSVQDVGTAREAARRLFTTMDRTQSIDSNANKEMLLNDVEDIDLFIKLAKDDGTVTELFTRAQDHVSIAEYKLRFIRTLENSQRDHLWRLKEILGEDDDEVKFVIRVR